MYSLCMLVLPYNTQNMSHLMKKKKKNGMCAQRRQICLGIRSV